MLIFRFIFLFWVITRVDLRAQKRHQFPHTVQCCSALQQCIPRLRRSVLPPVSLR